MFAYSNPAEVSFFEAEENIPGRVAYLVSLGPDPQKVVYIDGQRKTFSTTRIRPLSTSFHAPLPSFSLSLAATNTSHPILPTFPHPDPDYTSQHELPHCVPPIYPYTKRPADGNTMPHARRSIPTHLSCLPHAPPLQ